MADQTRRRLSLERLFGNKAVKRQLEALQKILEDQGIAKKELSNQTKAIMEDLIAKVDDLLSEFTDKPQEDLRNRLIATVMGALASAESEAPSEEAPEEELPPEEIMQDGEEDEEDEEEEEGIPAAFAKMYDEVLRVAEESADTYKAMAEFIPVFTDAVKMLEDVLPVIPKLGNLSERMAVIEKQFAGRPRIASRDIDTVVSDEDAEKQLTEGLRGKKTVFGHEVKE